VQPEFVTIPQQLYEQIQDVVLAADVMFVNGLPFFVSLSRGIKLFTVEFTPSRTKEQLSNKLKKVIYVYRRAGYRVRCVLMDMEFESLCDTFEDGFINTTAAREHVGDIERGIRFLEERARCVLSEVPFKHCMQDIFVVHLMMFVAMWINAFPSDSGVSTVYSPREIVTGLRMDYAKHCRARWGSYVEAHDDPDITNDMRPRTSPCIVLGPTGNIQGSIKCYNLETKAVVKRRNITPLPMPDRVIKCVIDLGKRAKQTRTARNLQFLDRSGQEFDWTVDESEGLVEPSPSDTDGLAAKIPGVLLESDMVGEVVQTPPGALGRRFGCCCFTKRQSRPIYSRYRDCRSGFNTTSTRHCS
jgi:hypothetical protein